MTDKILNGKALSLKIEAQISEKSDELLEKYHRRPKLIVILVGNDPASSVYVRNKELAAKRAGIERETIVLSNDTTEAELLSHIDFFNKLDTVDGILVQLPLPAHINAKKIISAINPEKDVDGFHPESMGRLLTGVDGLTPCTPTGIIEILKKNKVEIAGKNAVVIGRSNIVGKPVAIMLLSENATVTIVHSKTQNLKEITKSADILVVAAGKPHMLKPDMVKPGVIIVDVGIHKTEKGLVGDIHPDCYEIASKYTPVPGGVGPMTVACLMQNTLKAFMLKHQN